MTTLAQLQRQIAELQAEAERVRQSEVAGVVSRIREAIATYGLTASDLGFGKPSGAPKGQRRVEKGVGIPKYRDPATGKTWTGRGTPPMWIAGAKDRAVFLIDGSSQQKPLPSLERAFGDSPAVANGGSAREGTSRSSVPRTKAAKKPAANPSARKPRRGRTAPATEPESGEASA